MKKVILFLAIVALASCGNGSSSSESTAVDSTVVSDTTVVKDTTVGGGSGSGEHVATEVK